MKKQHIGLSALVLAFAGSAHAVPLTDLLNGGSIAAGDALFDQWQVIFEDTSDFQTINTDNIEVTALADGGLDPGPGLRFDILNNEFSVTGDGLYAYIDFQFGFHVSLLDPDGRLKDNWLGDLDALLSYVGDGSNDNGAYILENVGTALGLSDLAVKDVEYSVLDDNLISDLTDSAAFAPQSEIWVTKNILVWAADPTDEASLRGFSQRFSSVPEPPTLVLFGLSMAGLAFRRARQTRLRSTAVH